MCHVREEEKLRDVTLVREDKGGCGAHRVIQNMPKHKTPGPPTPRGTGSGMCPMRSWSGRMSRWTSSATSTALRGRMIFWWARRAIWPEVAEWCTTCPQSREAKYRIKGKTEKKEKPVEKDQKEVLFDCEEVKVEVVKEKVKEEVKEDVKEEREEVDTALKHRAGVEGEVEEEEGHKLVTTSPKRRRRGRRGNRRRTGGGARGGGTVAWWRSPPPRC